MWTDFGSLLSKRARAEMRKFCFLKKEHMDKMMSLEMKDLVRGLSMITWLHAARPSNTCLLLPENITVRQETLEILWIHHKTVKFRGPYTTCSTITQQQAAFLAPWVASFPRGSYLLTEPMIPAILSQMRTVMRKVLPSADMRAFRRGALITMAMAGVPAATLMLLSGHTDERTLMKYLGNGKYFETGRRLMIEATANL